MSETAFEQPAESLADVAQAHDFDGAQPEAVPTPADDGQWQGPSPEEWQRTQEALAYYGSVLAEHQAQEQEAAFEGRVAELRDQLDELQWSDPDEYERIVREFELRPHLERIAQLEEYVAEHQDAQAVAEGEEVGFELLESWGVTGDDAETVWDRAQNDMQRFFAQFGDDEAQLAAYCSQATGLPPEQALNFLAEQVLAARTEQLQQQTRAAERPDSLVDLVRRAPAEPWQGERPESLKDIARRYTQGA